MSAIIRAIVLLVISNTFMTFVGAVFFMFREPVESKAGMPPATYASKTVDDLAGNVR